MHLKKKHFVEIISYFSYFLTLYFLKPLSTDLKPRSVLNVTFKYLQGKKVGNGKKEEVEEEEKEKQKKN